MLTSAKAIVVATLLLLVLILGPVAVHVFAVMHDAGKM